MGRLNNPEEMRIIYQTSKQVFAGNLSVSTACRLLLNKTTASEASLKMYFLIYAAMKKGTCYKMGTSAAFTQFLIESIFKDDGEKAVVVALSAAKQNAEYRISCGNAQPGIEAVCREIIAKYNLNIKYEDLISYQGVTSITKKNTSIRTNKTISKTDIEYSELPNNTLRLKISIGAIVFEAEGDTKTVINQEKRFTSETLPRALAILERKGQKEKQKKSSQSRKKSTSNTFKESTKKKGTKRKVNKSSTGETLINNHPYLTELKDRMVFQARMIPLMYCAQKDKLQKDFSISEIQKIMFEVLAEQVAKKQIEDIFSRRPDWFEKTNRNPRRYRLLDIGCDYARNILNEK